MENFVTDFLLQSGIVTIDIYPLAQQTSHVSRRHNVAYGAYRLESVWVNMSRWCIQ